MALDFWINFNNHLRQLETTQEWVAVQTGISVNTIRGWVSKDVYPRTDDAFKLAKALGTTIEHLMTGNDSLGLPKDVLLTAWEINRLPPQFKSIVQATLQSCKEQCLALELAKGFGA